MAAGGIKGKPETLPPQPRKKKIANPPGLYMWWPCNDGPHTINATGTVSVVLKQGLSLPYFTSSSDFGVVTFTGSGTGTPWLFDPLVGGWAYNNVAGQQGQTSSDPEIAFINFGEELFSVSVWAKLTGSLGAGTKGNIVFKAFSSTSKDIYVRADQTTGKWEFGYTTGGGGTAKNLQSTNAAVANRWYHLVGTIDGTTQKFYVDGDLVASQASGLPDANGEGWHVGADNASGGLFPGLIWNMMFFSHTLKPSEVKNLFLDPFSSFSVLSPPPIIPEVGGPPPPVPDPGTTGPIMIGQSATPEKPRDLAIGRNGGQKPLLQ